MNALTHNSATINATTNPNPKDTHSVLPKVENPTSDWNFTILRREAPTMTGIARKKEYSEAIFESNPLIQPPIMVEEDLDIPGHMARH